jgi:hypothetical protein
MNLQLTTTIPHYPFQLSYRDKILLIGSCFSEHIGQMMFQSGFHICSNPTGILFNPVSMAQTYQAILDPEVELPVQPVQRDDKWCSLYQHSDLFAKDPDTLQAKVKGSIQAARSHFEESSTIILTFGTAHAWRLKADGRIIANCQKQPGQLFEKILLSVDDIVAQWKPLITTTEQKRFIFTVSPVRHSRDGLHGNNLSKATLHLAAAALMQVFPEKCFYFPAYEMVIDELRDYRFFKEDMVHPSEQAVHYVWEKWSRHLYPDSVRELMQVYQALRKKIQHISRFEDATEARERSLQLSAEAGYFAGIHPEVSMKAISALLSRQLA